MESETRRKIAETVTDILKNSNIEETTEFTIRVAASERLGIDLSDSEHRQFVRSVVEYYLLAIAEEEDGRDKASEPSAPEETREAVQEEQEAKPTREDSDHIICQLSKRRNVVVQDFRGKRFVSIREYYHKDGKQLPTAKGISLPTEQWSAFKKSVPAIEEAITKMEATMRSEIQGKQNGDVLNPVLDAAPSESVPIDIGRFDGKNYLFWVQQMDSLLKQLKIAYVLTEVRPNSTPAPDASAKEIAEARAAEKRWVNDDFMCRRNILCYLSDHLFNQYSNRKTTAKELWEEIKLVYLYEEFGTKRSQVKRYIEFQMVDEKPLLEQVQEFNTIADSVVSAGMFFDENFHVSVIISKLPPSWKDIRIKLMREEYLPFWMLMERLRTEEESRNQVKQMGEPSNNNPGYHDAKKFGPSGADIKLSSIYGQRNKLEMNGKSIVCYVCGKKGHLSRNCWRKSDKQLKERRVEENGPTTPAVAEANMVGVTE